MCLRCNPASAPGTPPADWGDPVAPLTAARGLSRHGLLTGTYTAGPGAGILSGLARAAGPLAGIPRHGRGQWVVGDHHVHSIFSHDAKYLMRTQVEKAHAFGLDWLVFTEHSNYAHHAKGALDQKAELAHLRRQYPDLMLFQGLEWSIPAAGQACVVVAPGDNDAELLRAFEKLWDGRLNGWLEPPPPPRQSAGGAVRGEGAAGAEVARGGTASPGGR
ncbi:PHP domain-containing protein [Mobilicoccus caccae]|uniref:Polymerase/histidinol phosphatase N-terminal domain-containing protein n=1 Tax=Mobilicoccus caccae TaxID=1859295 RepID=A0ABQ6IY07_9MICO|nr:PHP domain-containing protein [Mobilicoccus caccae]GMA42291.1 hypothetical protein GCM10025883_43360 [Mobilicoccus caccae]